MFLNLVVHPHCRRFINANYHCFSKEPATSKVLDDVLRHRFQAIIPSNQVADILSLEAERYGIDVIRVPEEQLLVFISEAREGFQEHMSKGSAQ